MGSEKPGFFRSRARVCAVNQDGLWSIYFPTQPRRLSELVPGTVSRTRRRPSHV